MQMPPKVIVPQCYTPNWEGRERWQVWKVSRPALSAFIRTWPAGHAGRGHLNATQIQNLWLSCELLMWSAAVWQSSNFNEWPHLAWGEHKNITEHIIFL